MLPAEGKAPSLDLDKDKDHAERIGEIQDGSIAQHHLPHRKDDVLQPYVEGFLKPDHLQISALRCKCPAPHQIRDAQMAQQRDEEYGQRRPDPPQIIPLVLAAASVQADQHPHHIHIDKGLIGAEHKQQQYHQPCGRQPFPPLQHPSGQKKRRHHQKHGKRHFRALEGKIILLAEYGGGHQNHPAQKIPLPSSRPPRPIQEIEKQHRIQIYIDSGGSVHKIQISPVSRQAFHPHKGIPAEVFPVEQSGFRRDHPFIRVIAHGGK